MNKELIEAGKRYIVELIAEEIPEPEKEILLPVMLTSDGLVVKSEDDDFRYAAVGRPIMHNGKNYLIEGFVFKDGIERNVPIIWRNEKDPNIWNIHKSKNQTIGDVTVSARCALIDEVN